MKNAKNMLCIAASATMVLANAMDLDLAGTWTLTQVETNSVSCPVRVPGGIYTALLEAKYIPDPFWAQNEKKTQWPRRCAWRFSRPFEVPQGFCASKSVILRLEDVDCFATVWVNGHEVGKTANRFQRHEFDVKPSLRDGSNRIEVVFDSTELRCYAETNRYENGAVENRISNGDIRKILLARTVQCHGGWDWGITQMDTGLMGTVKLIAVDDARIDYVYTTQTFASDYSSVDVEVSADVYSPAGSTVDFAVSLGDVAKSENVVLKPGDNHLSLSLHMANPMLWWPNGMGKQPLYPLSVKVGSACVRRRIGLRKVEVVAEDDAVKDPHDAEKGQGMMLAVNGVRLFAKGADWIPCDAFENRQTPERYREILTDVRDSNMNCVRLWGGGQFEKDAFYDTCDELGILIWHDLMFACGIYPACDYFLDGVRKELAHQVRRLRDHCSIALWCGDNECRGYAAILARGRDAAWWKQTVRTLRRREDVCGEVCATYDPTRTFWPSSPSQGPDRIDDMGQNDRRGDMHYWEVFFCDQPFDNYYTIRPRFCSEFGFQSYPSIETALTYVPPEQLNPTAPDFFYHQKCHDGNKIILRTMLRYFRFPGSVEDVVYLSQVQQAMAMKIGIEHFRRLMPRCMGAIYWQLNDNWPVGSWSSIEYGGKWKHLQYQAKRFFSPHLVAVVPKFKDSALLEVWAVNDHGVPLKGEIALTNWRFGGSPVAARTLAMNVAPRTAGLVARFKVDEFGAEDERRDRFLSVEMTGRAGDQKVTFENDWQFQRYRESNIARADITTEFAEKDGLWQVALSTDKPAFFVWADTPGIKGVFSDNSFTLLPGRTKVLTFTRRAHEKATFADFRRAFTLKHLRDSYE